MATKTISIDLAAYDRLRKARIRPHESFSQVIKRAEWGSHSTGGALLEALERGPTPAKRILDSIDTAQREDGAPPDAWNE